MRTHLLSELNLNHVGQTVSLAGWVNRRRDHGGLIFIDLRDRFGITQLVFNPTKTPSIHHLAETLRSEWVISVQGKVIARSPGMANPKIATGEIEIEVASLEILSKAKTPPFSISDETLDINEEIRLQYRYLDLRRSDLSEKIVMRSKAQIAARTYLDSKGFLEITTPILGKSTPEGARDYLVPSRVHSGEFYALPQSPQLFKQLLMIGGIDRYFQFATCFRDEDLRADRQPEFTQIDLEMSFGTPPDLFPIVEGIVEAIFEKCLHISTKPPYKIMTYQEAMNRFGTDKPDLRFGMELISLQSFAKNSQFTVFHEQLKLGGTVKGLLVKGGADISRKGIEEYTQFVNQLGVLGLAWMKMQEGSLTSSIAKFFDQHELDTLIHSHQIEENDLLFMIADTKEKTNQALDHLRRKLAKDRGLIQPNEYAFTWVTDFPLFAWNSDENRLESMHHPFTSPHVDDIHLLETKPLEVRSSGYDLVLNGYEIGGGSQRIHNGELQKKIFEALKLTPEDIIEKFGFFVEALQYGTPPHLGLALGFDRIMMIVMGTENIRDVIAFPKTQKARDLMMDCPSPVADVQLKELSIALKKNPMAF
jgi:aspartyl-tRNA synthetase